MNNYPSNIKKLIRASDKGKFEAAYQLYQIFETGNGFLKDEEEASKYKNRCAELLSSYDFKVSALTLTNFKGFESLEFEFENNVSVFVGNNGSGKSTILEAIEKSLTNLSSRISTHSFNGDSIHEMEIMLGKNAPAKIYLELKLNDVPFEMELVGNRSLTETKERSDFKGINELSNLFKAINKEQQSTNFPLIASYNVERSNDVTTRDIDKSEEILDEHIWNQAKAYSKSLNGKSDFKLFFRWFKELIEAKNEDNTGLNDLKTRLKVKEDELKSPILQRLLDSSKDSPELNSLIDSYKVQIESLKKQINEYSTIKDKSLDIVSNAIYKFIPEFSDLRIQRKPLDMLVTKNKKETLSVLQLSQGEKSLLALIADVSRRLILLNPSMENPLEGSGVVIIDEIDLHLHPSWQQKIVTGLRSTFPNIQFFISTHSPQVCHTLDSSSVWLIRDGEKFRAPKGLRGSLSSWVLENLFKVNARPQEDKYTQALNDYQKLVYQDKYNTQEATTLRTMLTKHWDSSDEELTKLDLYIESKEWEKEFEED